ncbi:triose-phosphate isomerase family protein [Streptococcus respiraculi]
MRRPIVGLSQKNYRNTATLEKEYLNVFLEELDLLADVDIDLFYFPSLGVLHQSAAMLKGTKLEYGAQNIAPIANGAMTGEFSIESLVDIGGSYVELGHAERRKYFGETDELIRQKIQLAFELGVTPVLCIGDPERSTEEVRQGYFTQQLVTVISGISQCDLKRLVIAYEPVWAIGQAEAADDNYVWDSHRIIRAILTRECGAEVADAVRIIYGGSVSKENTKSLVKDANVDGVFVGRFGHNPHHFAEIIRLVYQIKDMEENR